MINRWFVAQVVGRGSLIIDEPSPQNFPVGTCIRTTGPDYVWTLDESGRMLLNGIPTNQLSDQQRGMSQENDTFQTPPQTPRLLMEDLETNEDGVPEGSGILFLRTGCLGLIFVWGSFFLLIWHGARKKLKNHPLKPILPLHPFL